MHPLYVVAPVRDIEIDGEGSKREDIEIKELVVGVVVDDENEEDESKDDTPAVDDEDDDGDDDDEEEGEKEEERKEEEEREEEEEEIGHDHVVRCGQRAAKSSRGFEMACSTMINRMEKSLDDNVVRRT